MITRNGKWLAPGGNDFTSLEDIAPNLGRIQRFGGVSDKWWTVLHHLVYCRLLVEDTLPTNTPEDELFSNRIQLHMMLHDVHEAFTGDIPRPWKTGDIKKLQQELDTRLYAFYDIVPPTNAEITYIKFFDDVALAAEAQKIGHERLAVYLGKPSPRATHLFENIHYEFPDMKSSWGEESDLVKEYLELFGNLHNNAKNSKL